MSTRAFLSHLRERDIQLWIEGEKLRFSAPPGALTPELRAELATRKAEIIAVLREASATRDTLQAELPPITRMQHDNAPPLSSAQQRLWFMHQLNPDIIAFNYPSALRLTGSLDGAALEQSLNDIVGRHETLRTTFEERDGAPVQVIASELHIPLHRTDLRHLAEGEREAAIAALLREHIQQPFDLTRGPLLRAHLFVLGDEDYLFLVNVHHIAIDGWSYGVFYRELVASYTAHHTGSPVSLPALPVQFADVACWQQQWLQTPLIEAQLAYWKQRLEGIPSLLQLPTDYPRPAVQRMYGATLRRLLPGHLVETLAAIGKEEGCTLFMTMMASFAALMMRYTGQTDIPIGTPVVERNYPEVEPLIGFLVNNLVFRLDLSEAPSFRALLQRTRTTALEAYDHQQVPFEQVVNAVQPSRDLSYQPLFQVLLAMELEPLQGLDLPGVQGRHLEVESGGSMADLALLLEERAEGLVGAWQYDTDLFEAPTIERMAEHFERLLSSLAASPDQPVMDISLMTAEERQEILVAWNDTAAPYPHDHCLHHLFEEQVERTPDAPAVAFEGQQLTYRELHLWSNAIAHQLRKRGVRREVRVGICIERSLEMVAGVLAILKAGGAYVPLDANYPDERLAFIIEDAHLSLLLTRRDMLGASEDSPLHNMAHVVYLDWETDLPSNDSPLNSDVSPDNLAYIIYTSGSTGAPKGVPVPHRGVVNVVYDTTHRKPGLSSQDTSLSVFPISFDPFAEDIFLPLTSGACMVIVPRDVAMDGEELSRRLQQTGGTLMPATPATWRMLIEAGWEGHPSLTIFSGGEAMPWDLAQQLLDRGKTLWNLYGPTETTICSVMGEVQRSDGKVFIGRPVANTQLYVLDTNRQPVPIGIPGELFIGGVGVARGYLNRPDLTAEKFVPDPFSGEPGKRLYRTGDMVRYMPDGRIEFLGRLDEQVKIRGFRIEPGEIEALLRQHPLLREAVTMVREDTPGNLQLVCYIVPDTPRPASEGSAGSIDGASNGVPLNRDEGQQQDERRAADSALINEVRHYLQAKLPDYMFPSAFVVLDALPLFPNGKVDRQSLPRPDLSLQERDQQYVAPRSPLEEVLALIWSEVLGVERISVHYDFFALGGHSLRATQITSRLQKLFQLAVPVRMLFEHPTVAGLAEALQQQEPAPGRIQAIAQVHQKVREMSPQEREAMLQAKKQAKGSSS